MPAIVVVSSKTPSPLLPSASNRRGEVYPPRAHLHAVPLVGAATSGGDVRGTLLVSDPAPEETVRETMTDDLAVARGVMTAKLYPYRIALMA
jgi:hypothetical protein